MGKSEEDELCSSAWLLCCSLLLRGEPLSPGLTAVYGETREGPPQTPGSSHRGQSTSLCLLGTRLSGWLELRVLFFFFFVKK